MKRLFVLCVGAGLLLSMCGMCIPSHAQAKEVAVIWDTKSLMVKNLVTGFLAEIGALAPDLRITVHGKLKNMEEAEKVYRDCESRVDGIVFLRSSGAEFLGKIKPKVPCFVGACNNPQELGVIRNLDEPEGMITGVTYFIPYSKRFDIIMSLFPRIKTVALLVEEGHPSGRIERGAAKQECDRRGLVYREVVAATLDQLVKGTRELGKVDLVIVTNTRLVMDNVTNLLPITNPTKTPVFSFAEKPVKTGAVAGIAADDEKLGAMLAHSVVDVVIKGKPVSKVPVKMDPAPKLTINEPMMRSLGLQFPETIMKAGTVIR
ncbi:MAG: ABC transporter substrate binding protein [Thermodesulfobacteriota bacterium]